MQTAASRTQNKPFTPLNLGRMKIPCGCICRAYRDKDGNTLFELCTVLNIPFMAFLYKRFSEKSFAWKRECFAKLVSPDFEAHPSLADIQQVVPVQKVSDLSLREMWPIYSSFGEDMFWASPSLQVEIQPSEQGSLILITHLALDLCAEIRCPECPSDCDYVLSMSLKLRKALHIQKAIRICSILEGKRLSWFIPSPCCKSADSAT